MTKRLWLFAAIALALRLLLIPVSAHPDLRGFNMAGQLIARGGEVFSFYDYISRLPRSHPWVNLYGDDLFIYPPLAYLTPAVSMLAFSPIFPWDLWDRFVLDMGQTVGDPGMPYLLYLLKLPYLIPDLIALLMIVRLVPGKGKTFAALLWMFNPVTIYSTYLMGQFDIYIAMFLLLGVYAHTRKKPVLAAICLGLAAGYKPFPLLMLPFLARDESIFTRVKLTAIGVATYAALILPYLGSAAYKQYALMAPQTDKLQYAKIMVSGSQYLSLFFVGLFLLYWVNLFRSKQMPVWGWFLSLTLLFYSVSHYHPQWYMWGVGFMVLAAATVSSVRWTLGFMLGCFFMLVLLFEPSLNFGLFGINFVFSDWVTKYYPADQLASVVRSAFFASSAVTIWLLSRPSNHESAA